MTSFKSIKYLVTVFFLSIKSFGKVNLKTFVCLCYFVRTFVVCLSLEKSMWTNAIQVSVHASKRETAHSLNLNMLYMKIS